jgi:hypothetical protein
MDLNTNRQIIDKVAVYCNWSTYRLKIGGRELYPVRPAVSLGQITCWVQSIFNFKSEWFGPNAGTIFKNLPSTLPWFFSFLDQIMIIEQLNVSDGKVSTKWCINE